MVAKKAGVSVATVSRVLNHPDIVSGKTKEHIISVIKELDYTPNWFARNIQSRTTQVVGLVVPDILSPSNMEIIKGVEEVARKKQVSIILCDSEYRRETERKNIEGLISRHVDGIALVSSMLTGKELDDLKKRNIKYVLMGKSKDCHNENIVYTDYAAASEEAIQYLLKFGHKKIAFINEENSLIEANEKLEGYKRALEKAGIKYREELVIRGPTSIEGGFVCMSKLLDNSGWIDAVFAAKDIMAFGAMEKMKQKGISIPNDIALISFDNLEVGAVVEPKLTTMTNPMYRIGLVAARLLFDIIEEGVSTAEGQEIVLKSRMKIRKSCGNKERLKEIW